MTRREGRGEERRKRRSAREKRHRYNMYAKKMSYRSFRYWSAWTSVPHSVEFRWNFVTMTLILKHTEKRSQLHTTLAHQFKLIWLLVASHDTYMFGVPYRSLPSTSSLISLSRPTTQSSTRLSNIILQQTQTQIEIQEECNAMRCSVRWWLAWEVTYKRWYQTTWHNLR